MKIQQIRNATLKITYCGHTFLVDPWLLKKGAFGTFRRKSVDLKTRGIAVIAALAALGNARPQLKIHFRACLNVGFSRM